MKKAYDYEKEQDIWYEFYLKFNDDNLKHADEAFFNNEYFDLSAEQLHKRNLDWFAEILSHGISHEEIIKIMPAAKEYGEELMRMKEETVIESIIDSDITESYEKETGKAWSIAEEHMAEICSFYDYGFAWNEAGNIVINNGFYDGSFDGVEIYKFFGKNIEKNAGEEFNGVQLDADLKHYEYQSAEEMVKEWTDICKQSNEDYVKNDLRKPFE